MRNTLGICALSVALIHSGQNPSWGQNHTRSPRLLDLSLEELGNVSITSAARHRQKQADSPRFVSVVTAEEIRRKNFRTVPEALREAAGVFVQHTNYGGGSPIIRGLVGNQILILVDGIRMNNAIYRLGPNQYLNTIDINQVERIEVVHGSGSVLYGSDALGGLVQVITKSAVQASGDSEFNGRVFGRLASADRSAVGRVEVGARRKGLSLVGGVSVKSFGDLRAGHGIGKQPFTGYEENDGDLKLSLGGAGRQRVTFALQQVTQQEVPRTDRLASGSDLRFEWNPQRRQLGYMEYAGVTNTRLVDSFEVLGSFQKQAEDLFRVAKAKPGTESQQSDEVQSSGVTVQLHTRPGERQLLTWGADWYSDLVISRRVDVDLVSGRRITRTGRFADGAKYRSLGVFAQNEIQLADPLAVTLGVRYSHFHLDALASDSETGAIRIGSRAGALTGSAYALYKFRKDAGVFFGVAQGFRAPNVDDSTILGSFGGGFEVPNADLEPEQSLNYEAGIKGKHKNLSGSTAYFISNYNDLIAREPGSFRNLSFLDLNGNNIPDDREDRIFQRKNIGKARIQGIEVQAAAKLAETWTLSGNLAWVKGNNTITREPLRRIPPLHGFVSLQWAPSRGTWVVEYYSSLATSQGRLSPGDIRDQRIAAGGTPGFRTSNLRAGTTIRGLGRVTIDLENITNRSYRFHGSGIDAPGFGVVIGLQRRF